MTTQRQFYVLHKSWYTQTGAPSEIVFGLYDPQGCSVGEMSILWKELGGELVPCLKAFGDSWAALASFSGLILEMAELNGRNISPDDFEHLLDRNGFSNKTEIAPSNKSYTYSVWYSDGVPGLSIQISREDVMTAIGKLANPRNALYRLQTDGAYSFPFAVIYAREMDE